MNKNHLAVFVNICTAVSVIVAALGFFKIFISLLFVLPAAGAAKSLQRKQFCCNVKSQLKPHPIKFKNKRKRSANEKHQTAAGRRK